MAKLKNLKHEKFCKEFVFGKFVGHGTEAYLAVYPDVGRTTASANSSRLLGNAKILARIEELLNSEALNDQIVDAHLSLLLRQMGDYKTKLGAIREYNKLKQRITEKIDHTIVDRSEQGEKITASEFEKFRKWKIKQTTKS